MDELPSWIPNRIIMNDLPWNNAEKNRIYDFHKKYSLLDSYWLGAFHNVAYDDSITLAVQWDSYCLPKKVKKTLANPDDWLYLFIRITKVKMASHFGFSKSESPPGGVQRSISTLKLKAASKERLLSITDTYGGKTKILFNGECRFLVLDEAQNIIKCL